MGLDLSQQYGEVIHIRAFMKVGSCVFFVGFRFTTLSTEMSGYKGQPSGGI